MHILIYSAPSALSMVKLFSNIKHPATRYFFIEKIHKIWYNIINWGGNDSRQEREARGDPHEKEQQFQSNLIVSSDNITANEWSITNYQLPITNYHEISDTIYAIHDTIPVLSVIEG